MFLKYLSVIIIGFIMITPPEVSAIREKPIRDKPTIPTLAPPPIIETKRQITETPLPVEISIPTVAPESESSGEDNVQVGKVIKTKTLTRILHNNYDKLRNKYDTDSPTQELTEVSITPTKTPFFKKTKKVKFTDDEESPSQELTETLSDITKTVDATVKVLGQSVVSSLLSKMVKSKLFMLIMIIITITGCVGWILKILVK